MSCQQVPTAPAFNPYPRSVQVGEFEVAIGGGIWVAIGAQPARLSYRTRKSDRMIRMPRIARALSDFPKQMEQPAD